MRNTMRRKSGFTIIEMLMALSITAMLLTALAASINASMINVKANEESYKTINSARQALNRMSMEIRTSQGVTHDDPTDLCTLVTAAGDDVFYEFDSASGELILGKDGVDYLMCKGVESMTFTKGLDPDNNTTVRNVQITMTVNIGNVSKKLSTATVVMINMP